MMLSELDDWMSDEESEGGDEGNDDDDDTSLKKKKKKIQSKGRHQHGKFAFFSHMVKCSS